jgi:hypothetical protein
MAPNAEIHFQRLAVTPEQIRNWNLPTRPTKKTDSRAKGFGDLSVELDAIPPHRLRALVQEAIERHLPPGQYKVLRVAEESERRLIRGLVGMAKATLPEPEQKPQQPAPKFPVQAYASLARFFDLDGLTEEAKADWTLFAENLVARGYQVDRVIDFCGHLLGDRGYDHPANYLGPEQWREIKEGRG